MYIYAYQSLSSIVNSRFGFDGFIWVLIASVPDVCILFTSTVIYFLKSDYRKLN